MFQLARELEQDGPVLVTATSHLGVWQIPLADQHIVAKSPAPIERLEYGLRGVILITGELHGDRMSPVNDYTLNWLYQFCGYHSMPLLIEADGSRQKPLKAWADHEPPIPSFVDSVTEVAGLSALGKPLSAENIHRHDIFSGLSGLRSGEMVTSDALARLLLHPNGGQKNIPGKARKVMLLNQADTPDLQSVGHGMTSGLLSEFDSVVISSLRNKTIFAAREPVAGIVLAAGGSTRYGTPKQLLDWKGQSFVRAVAKTALDAGLSPVIVVVGANAEKVEESVRDLGVMILRNEDWKSGQASSINAAVKRLTSPLQEEKLCGATIFLLVDQPQVNTSVLSALMEKHAEGLQPILAPMVMDRRANPVLFDRDTFGDLMTLEGDTGGRAIFHKHRVEYLPWHDDRLLLDVDTPEQYQRLISDETL